MTAKELAEPLEGGAGVVEGERKERETTEQFRVESSREYDLLLIGGWLTVLNTIRPSGVTIVRESLELTGIREIRLRASFVTVSSTRADGLLTWKQTVELTPDLDTYADKRYAGVNPLIVQEFKSAWRLRQSGEATALDGYVVAPLPIESSAPMSRAPTISLSQLSAAEFKTTWTYEFFVSDSYVLVGGHEIPPVTVGRY